MRTVHNVTDAAALTLTVGTGLISVTLTDPVAGAGSSLIIERYDSAGVAEEVVSLAVVGGTTGHSFGDGQDALQFSFQKAATTPPQYLLATVVGDGTAILYCTP